MKQSQGLGFAIVLTSLLALTAWILTRPSAEATEAGRADEMAASRAAPDRVNPHTASRPEPRDELQRISVPAPERSKVANPPALIGRVHDEAGAPLAGATVTCT